MDQGTVLVLAWKWRDGAWREWWVPFEHYSRIVALAHGPNGDPTISLVSPARTRSAA